MPRTATSRPSPRPAKPLDAEPRTIADAHPLLLASALHDRPIPIAWLELFAIPDTAIDALLHSSQLIETADGLSPGPMLDRERVSKSAPFSQRRAAHLALAEACLRPIARFEAAAQHFQSAGKSHDAASAWLRAADAHCRRHHHTAANRCFAAALCILPVDTPDGDIVSLLKNFEHCATLGRDIPAAIARLREWSDSPPWRDRPAIRAEAALTLAALLGHTARHIESAQARRSAARDLATLGRPADAARASLAAATTLAYSLQLTLASQTATEALQFAERAGDVPAIAEATKLGGFILGMQGNTGEGRALVERALALALKHQLTGTVADAYRLLGSVAEYASCYRDEQAAFSSALAFCRRHDQDTAAGLCLGCLAYSLFRSGNWKRCEEIVRRVLADHNAHPVSRMVTEGVLGLLHAYRGENRPATKWLARSLTAGRQMGIIAMDFFNLLGLALVAETAGDDAQASAHYRTLFETWQTTEDRHDAIPGLSRAVVFYAARGQREETAGYAEALELIAASTANPEAAGAARLAAAELHLLDGETAAAITAFRDALGAFEKRDLSVELMQTRIRLAGALMKSGEITEARALLTDTTRSARRLGARPLAATAEVLRVVTSPSRAKTSGPAGDISVAHTTWEQLSSRQRQVARHLARGAANKEIACALSLSVRTVEMHVAAVLARLDCRSRAQAAARISAELA